MNTFRQMRLDHEKCSLKIILFWTFKQYSNYKNYITQTFGGNISKLKAAIKSCDIQIIKNKSSVSTRV